MRILSIGNFLNPSWDGSLPDEQHILEALGELGYVVKGIQRKESSALILDIHHALRYLNGADGKEKYDFILLAQWDGYPADMIETMHEWIPDTPIVYWAFDYQADGQEWHERLVNQADLYLSKRIADFKYPNWQWLSQDFAPAFLDKWDAVIDDNNYELDGSKKVIHKDIDVLFTGSYLPWATERNETLKAVDEKFNLVIHSVNEWPGFKDVRPPVMDEGLPELYARAKVILSFDHTLEAGYWSDRNAQIMACGRSPLFRYVPLSEARFGQHVIYFYNLEGCLERIDDLLVHPQEDIDSADELAYEYAHKNLMVQHRVDNLIRIVDNYLCHA